MKKCIIGNSRGEKTALTPRRRKTTSTNRNFGKMKKPKLQIDWVTQFSFFFFEKEQQKSDLSRESYIDI